MVSQLRSRRETRLAVFEFIKGFSNRRRPHSALGCRCAGRVRRRSGNMSAVTPAISAPHDWPSAGRSPSESASERPAKGLPYPGVYPKGTPETREAPVNAGSWRRWLYAIRHPCARVPPRTSIRGGRSVGDVAIPQRSTASMCPLCLAASSILILIVAPHRRSRCCRRRQRSRYESASALAQGRVWGTTALRGRPAAGIGSALRKAHHKCTPPRDARAPPTIQSLVERWIRKSCLTEHSSRSTR